jgi:DNA-binding winged helix-turn-helix (wHTH) protein
MPAPHTSSDGKIVRFGIFEADLVSGELRKTGSLVRLQEQPFQVLVMLLERPGEVVTREQLRTRLWPADTFVDFDHSLNTAVNKLREALGDSASSPRFVETVARRGYRFLAPVQEDSTAAAQSAPGNASPPLVAPATLHPELELPVPRRGLTRGLFLLIQVMYLAFYMEALVHWQAVHQIAESFLPGWAASIVLIVALVSAGIGIPLRCYLISATAFDYQRLGEKFQHLFLGILALDLLWAIAPFLLAARIGFGAAFAGTAALLYLPFSERSLVRMAYPPRRS